MTPSYASATSPQASHRKAPRTRKYVAFVTCLALVIGAVVAVILTMPWVSRPTHPTKSVRYLGVYEPGTPYSYANLDHFALAIGRQPNLVIYYTHWLDPFQVSFATVAAKHDATTVVQIDPDYISLANIAAGRYDAYIRSYATAIKAFGAPVVVSFGHEMNGNWYSWGYQRTPADVFVAAWRHIVTVFRSVGAKNVIWLWTVNIIDKNGPIIPDPASWWPGSSYVTWVGIDGYYYSENQSFAQVFGPTIIEIRAVTGDPILIAETGASLAAGQPAKITDLFAGIQAYGLLGFVWFDADDTAQALDWRISSRAAWAAFRQDAAAFMKPAITPVTAQSTSSGAPPP